MCTSLVHAMKLFLLLVCLHSAIGGYVITTPQKWAAGYTAQVCLNAFGDVSPDDEVLLTVYSKDQAERRSDPWVGFRPPSPRDDEIPRVLLIESYSLKPTAGAGMTCTDVPVPRTTSSYGDVELRGAVAGASINESRQITFATTVKKIYIQTDKYLYKAGQKVQFRVLTIEGPYLKVSTEPYAAIYVESPSASRIAQWLNVSNDAGLIHEELQLIEEPEEGTYTIVVQPSAGGEIARQTFKIEDYVLPRFELTIKPPSYILGTANETTFEVCAQYTFGQPLRGKLTGEVNNSGWGRNKVTKPIDTEIYGCKELVISLSDLNINSYRYMMYQLNIKLTVEEEGTGSIAQKEDSAPITRTALNMISEPYSEYKKQGLPYTTVISAKYPDDSPAANEDFSACLDKLCKNVTSDESGYVRITIPPHLIDSRRLVVSSLKHKQLDLPPTPEYSYSRSYMYASSHYTYSSLYYSPSNSSLMLLPPEPKTVVCNTDGSSVVELPLLYAANSTQEAVLQIQVISRGQVQFSDTKRVTFVNTELPRTFTLLEFMQPPPQGIIRGATSVTLNVPTTMSDKFKVLVWYTRADGEVVPDSREVPMQMCLDHQVSMSWPVNEVEQGTTLPLTIKAQPQSLCSLGIVDKSVELLAAGRDSLTINTIFDLIRRVEPSQWEANQVDDYKYCQAKETPTPPEPIPEDETTTGQPEVTPEPVPVAIPARTKRSSPPRFRFNTNLADAIKMFDNAGVFIISDQTYETRPCNRYEEEIYFAIAETEEDVGAAGFGGGGFAAAGPPQASVPSVTDQHSKQDSSRTYFPETWLWQLTPVLETGVYTQDLTLPDTITEWVGKAVCVHPEKGVGLSPTTSITTFTPFFVDLTLLPSIRKGEIMPIKISVFNYLNTSLPVTIILEPSVEFEILQETGTLVAENQNEAGTNSVCIPQGDKQTVTIRVRPLVVGDVNVAVSATVDGSITDCASGTLPQKRDRIITPINVEYEGFPREKTWTNYVCSEDVNENEDFAAQWTLEAPQNIVEESPRSWLTVVGDLMGPTLENLGNLIRMPYGCGEQNMLNFAPNIYVLQYLEASGQINAETRSKLERFMRSGYQRELNYKHDNGAYSAFGKSDNSGSTWLTAFVVKSFAQSRAYIDINPTELEMSTDWLKSTQLVESGCFESRGKVLHKGMKGGLGEDNVQILAAYLLAALLEAGEDPASEVITNGITCIQGTNPDSVGQDPYEMSVKAYALSLARHATTETALQDLLSFSTNTTSGIFWQVQNSKGTNQNSETPAVAVETAAYVLMAMLHNNPDKYMQVAHLIVKWISEQRNSQGGFISTQDTVLALQALALYETYQTAGNLSLQVNVQGKDYSSNFQVNENNKLLNQRVDIPLVPNSAIIDVTGTGCALIQAVVRYNVQDPEPSEAFTLSVSQSSGSLCKSRLIKVCSSYLLRDGKSNMAVIEVNLVSGYIPIKEDLKKVVNGGTGIIKRYELERGNTVLFYIDEFTSRETCIEFGALQESEVEESKPGTVKVYDYYEPEFVVTETFTLPERHYCPSSRPVPDISIEGIIVDDEEVLETTELPATTLSPAEV